MARLLYVGASACELRNGDQSEIQVDSLTVLAASLAEAQLWAYDQVRKKWPPGLGFRGHTAQMFEMPREVVVAWLAAYDEPG